MYQATRANAANDESYYYETPMWNVRLLCLVAIVISLLCIITLVYFLKHKAYIDWPFTIMLSAMAIGFGIAGGKPPKTRVRTRFSLILG